MIKAYFDGCCEPINPGGTASYGFVIFEEYGSDEVCQLLFEDSKIFVPVRGREKETSNNVAEYSGFKRILEWLIEEGMEKEVIEICGDSNLVIQQMFGTWKIKRGFYVPIAKECLELLKRFPTISGKWIRRDENSIADKLSKAELIKAGVKFRIQPDRR